MPLLAALSHAVTLLPCFASPCHFIAAGRKQILKSAYHGKSVNQSFTEVQLFRLVSTKAMSTVSLKQNA